MHQGRKSPREEAFQWSGRGYNLESHERLDLGAGLQPESSSAECWQGKQRHNSHIYICTGKGRRAPGCSWALQCYDWYSWIAKSAPPWQTLGCEKWLSSKCHSGVAQGLSQAKDLSQQVACSEQFFFGNCNVTLRRMDLSQLAGHSAPKQSECSGRHTQWQQLVALE